jgi:PAS domain S-box-containing protein
VDPWAQPAPRRDPAALRLLLPLSAGLAAAAMVFVLLHRTPVGAPIETAASLRVATGKLGQALIELKHGQADAGEHLARSLADIDQQLVRLHSGLADDGIQLSELDDFSQAWSRTRFALREPADVDVALVTAQTQAQAAATLAQSVRLRLDQRRGDIELGLKCLMAVLAALLLLPLHGIWRRRERQRLRSSLHQFCDDLGSGTWRDAVHNLREDRSGPSSAFDALASGVESVLGESDRRWQALADLSADWYWEADTLHRLSWLSGSASALISPGWSADAVLGRRHDQVGFFRPPAMGWAALHACMARGEAFRDVEFQIASGSAALWVSISGRARQDAHGRLIGYEGVGRNVSERKSAHERLLASEQRWSMMARLASDWYWQTDAEHRLLPLSADQLQRFGDVLAERIEGRTRWEAHRDALTPQQWADHRADLDARRPFRSLHLEVDAGDGRYLWTSISGIPRFDSARRFVGYHGVGRDITARKQAERLLLRHNEELQRAVRERTRDLQQMNLDLEAFARQLAHELRTPIGQVQGLAQLLGERGAARLNAEDRQLLDLQVQAAHRMRDTVDALLALARSTLQPMPLQDLDLSRLAHEVLGELPALQRAAPLRAEVRACMRVQANPAALKIVLVNLLGNAAKFTRDTAAPWVRVAMQADDDGRVRVSVQDNGAGFDPSRAAQLFRPFSRLHARDDYAGSGIGLSIVQRIVERHGGTVSARGAPGEGACFEFTLACAKTAPAAAQLEYEAEAAF